LKFLDVPQPHNRNSGGRTLPSHGSDPPVTEYRDLTPVRLAPKARRELIAFARYSL
jgi:hypothetical protein